MTRLCRPCFIIFFGILITATLLLHQSGKSCEFNNFSTPTAKKVTFPAGISTTKKMTFSDGINYLEDVPGRLWFMKDGWVTPENGKFRKKSLPVWPNQSPKSDRIINQLMFIPSELKNKKSQTKKLKKILFYNGFKSWFRLTTGRQSFIRDKCPVSTCTVTEDQKEAETADAVVFHDRGHHLKHNRKQSQVWIFFTMEGPPAAHDLIQFNTMINWTITYRHDSDIVTPYRKFVPYKKDLKLLTPQRNFAFNKTGKVAWFVSNCRAQNGRLEYAKKLSMHINVDIYGRCGNKSCPRNQSASCFKLLQTHYKFYLAFENSNCKEYISEKFFNALGYNVIPIVMGARKKDYVDVAPAHSFIHIEDFVSPESLAAYLHILDKNDNLYNEYFMWKGTGEFINVLTWCRLCALLHDQRQQSYNDIEKWWRGPGTCLTKINKTLGYARWS